ncbi:MAG: hypothetical protein Q9163_001809 [Psora crenata]
MTAQGNVDGEVFNPYMWRADAIACNHSIPGFGHLGNVLQPSTWTLGTEPLDEQKVLDIYLDSRDIARRKLEEESTGITNESLDQFTRRRIFDDTILIERTRVARDYQRYKLTGAQLEKQQEQTTPPTIRSSQCRRLGSNPLDIAHGYPQGRIWPHARPHSPAPNGASMFHGLRQLRQSKYKRRFKSSGANTDNRCCHLGHLGIYGESSTMGLSEAAMPTNIAEVDYFYRTNRTTLLQLLQENERYYPFWSEIYGRMPHESPPYERAGPSSSRPSHVTGAP